MCSCAAAVVKEPQPFYVVNTKFMSVAKGTKSFDYRKGHNSMTEWVLDPVLINWEDSPENLACFPLEIWLKKVKPALKELARKDRDRRN